LIKLFKITKNDKSINNKNEVDINIEILAQPLESPYDTLGRIQWEIILSFKSKNYFILLNKKEIKDSLTIHKALESSESIKQNEAIKEELEFIIKNNVWLLVDLPKDRKFIGYKWIFLKKI